MVSAISASFNSRLTTVGRGLPDIGFYRNKMFVFLRSNIKNLFFFVEVEILLNILTQHYFVVLELKYRVRTKGVSVKAHDDALTR